MRGECVVGVDAGCTVRDGFRSVADVGNAMVDVAAFVVLPIGMTVGKIDGNYFAGFVVGGNGVAVGVDLSVDGTAGVRDAGLIEGNGDDLMTAEVADVSDLEGEVFARLPLDVERVVVGVGKFVGAVVDAERDGLAIVLDLGDVGEIFVEVRGLRVR